MTLPCSMKAVVGDRVRVEYYGTLKDDKAVVRRLGRKVFEFTVGSNEVMPGISRAVVGMVEGERKQLTLSPRDAYGEFREGLIQEISRQRFPADMPLKVGKKLTTISPKTQRRRKVRIVEVRSNSIIVDGNHPLAGKSVEVEFQLLLHESSSARTVGSRKHDLGGEA